MAMLPTMLAQDRKQAAWSVGQAAWRLGVSVREYREIEARRALAERGDVQPDLRAVRLAADVRWSEADCLNWRLPGTERSSLRR